MGLIVQKFGGSSVRDRERLLRAMRIVRRTWEQGDDVVVVLSAQGDTTDALLARARELTEEPPLRELDALLATGETASVALGAIALASLGVPAVSLSGWQVPVGTDGTHGGANVRSVGAERIRQELAQRRVVLAAGFQGVDAAGDVTTLGRGGSDTSAVALAAFLGAERCIIYTDVDGVYTTDPRVCPTARRLAAVSCDQMLRLAANGAQVLHDRSVALAARHGVTVEVRSCEEGSVGTLVVPRAESGEVTGVTRSRRGEVTRVTAIGRAQPSLAAIRAAVSALEAAGITGPRTRGGRAARHAAGEAGRRGRGALRRTRRACAAVRERAVCAAKAAANRSFLCLPLLTDGEKNGFFIRRKESVAIPAGICYPTLNRSALREQPISTGRMLRRLSTLDPADPLLPKILVLVILILINAFFAAAEIAVISLSETKLRKQAEEGDKKAKKLLVLMQSAGQLSFRHSDRHHTRRLPGPRPSRRTAFPIRSCIG